MYNYKGIDIKTSLTDMTIGEFERVSEILQDNTLDNIERYFKLLKYLGVPDHELDHISDQDFFAIVGSFDKLGVTDHLVPSFQYDDVTYVAHSGEFTLKAKDLMYIEKRVKENTAFFAYAIAILFKPEGMDSSLAYAPKVVEQRVKIAKNLNAAEFYSYIIYLTTTLAAKTSTLVAEQNSYNATATI